MLEIIITVGILSFIIGGCSTLITILFLMGASPDTPTKRADDLRESVTVNVIYEIARRLDL